MISLPAGIRPGAHVEDGGTRFTLYSSVAEQVTLCLFDDRNNEVRQIAMTPAAEHIWSLRLNDCGPGQRYGFRVAGPYRPSAGLRCNPHKLLVDPYARLLAGELEWHPAVHGYAGNNPQGDQCCTLDSAPYVPKAVVCGRNPAPAVCRPDIAWRDSIIYELNVRGYTMRCPELSAAERGRFAGLTNGQILDYLRALGITAIELLPVQAFVDEQFLVRRGLRNYWGYNTLGYFAPASRYAGSDPIGEFRGMVDAIHDAGLEVILDVVYNHTAETDEFGPTLSFRGIDNASYYRLVQDAPGYYVNDAGCGNILDAEKPAVQALILDSLEYWHADMGVDGFRFDLATILGRTRHGFDPDHPLLQAIENHPALSAAKLIAEPWDIGPGGYQLGNFGAPWAEWNDRYRDSVRQFWRGDSGTGGEFARRVHGSAAEFAGKQAGPAGSINFVASHDGFTLLDVVSFSSRHNAANGEHNADGHAHNYSHNYGTEGRTEDAGINALRRRQRLNMLATLLISQGTPMLLAGDEFGHSQQGNNNAYAQDNELTWLDRSGLLRDPEFAAQVSAWIALRRQEPMLRGSAHMHGEKNDDGTVNLVWLKADGEHMDAEHWQQTLAFSMVICSRADDQLAILFNASDAATSFCLPAGGWVLRLATGTAEVAGHNVTLQDHCIAVLKTVAV